MFDIFDAAEHCELDLEGVAAEFSPAQMELNMKYGPAMDAADRAFISRDMVRVVLRAMKAEGLIEPNGKGRGAKWQHKQP